jgi:hypothetical protein
LTYFKDTGIMSLSNIFYSKEMKMKNKRNWFFGGVLVLVLIFSIIIISCDDNGGNDGITINGWTWTAYTDRENAGISTITMTQGTGNNSNRITMSGNVALIPGQTYGYAGLIARPNAEMLAELRSGEGLFINAVGDGKKYIVEVRTSDITDYSYFRAIFTAPLTPDSGFIYYNNLESPGWGQSQTKSFDKSKITHIEFQARAESEITGEGSFNLTIW